MTALETYVLILLIISLSVIGILLIAAVTIGIINSVKKQDHLKVEDTENN